MIERIYVLKVKFMIGFFKNYMPTEPVKYWMEGGRERVCKKNEVKSVWQHSYWGFTLV